MGLFSNLFGNDGKEIDKAFGKLKDIADDLSGVKYPDEDEKRLMNNQSPVSGNTNVQNTCYSAPAPVSGPSGESWGPVMPSEENQFNSGLRYQDYFTKVFNEASSAYQIDKEDARNGSAALFTFSQGGVKKLVVEVISSGSSPHKVRNDCRKQGIAYLRYYYDYDGWWNTRSYVISRTSKALGIV